MNRYIKDVIRGKKAWKGTPFLAIPVFLYAAYLYVWIPFYNWLKTVLNF